MSSSYIHVDGWRSNLRFSSAHIIPEYEKCGRLHGHSYAVHARIFGTPDDKGIILDFSLVKDALHDIVKTFDHKILIPERSSKVDIQQDQKNIRLRSLGKEYLFPVEDCMLLPITSTSAESLAGYILSLLLDRLPVGDTISAVEVGVDEGYGQGARIRKNLQDA
jgi:6-pyruvoyltetrahydropterin/6-carboxytetrahydropterin synthase